MTLALARKYRPRTFTEVVGQDHVVRALTNALTQQRLHHAYLLTGTRGVGKTTLARIIAKALNCETGITATPCGKCGACVEIDAGRFVDLIELDAASNTQVDSMRELLENAMYAPTAGRFKVYIIDEVHMLSKSAFNAMLKTLEEPPEHVKFILATTDPQKVPVTVLSRCLQFGLKQIPPAVIRTQLEKVLGLEHLKFEAGALQLIARAAQGSMRDSLSLLDQAIAYGAGVVQENAVRDMLGVVDSSYLFGLLETLAKGDGPTLLEQAAGIDARGLSLDTALQELGSLLQRVALAQVVPNGIPDDEPERERLFALAAAFSPEDVQLHYQIALRGRADLHLAPDDFAGFSMALLRMLAFVPRSNGAAMSASRSTAASAAGSRTVASAAPGAINVSRIASSVSDQARVQSSSQRNATNGAQPLHNAVTVTSASWPDLVTQLGLGGMARMLAQHCVLNSFSDGRLVLELDDAYKHLLDPAYRQKLKDALESRLGPVRLEISVGQAHTETPAQITERQREVARARAEEAIENDPFVRELRENLGARVVEGSVQPLPGAE